MIEFKSFKIDKETYDNLIKKKNELKLKTISATIRYLLTKEIPKGFDYGLFKEILREELEKLRNY